MGPIQKRPSISRPGLNSSSVVLVRIPGAVCAFPIEAVVETTRPLPTSAFTGMPEFLLGIALVRGIPTPVVDLNSLFQGSSHAAATRFVILRTGERTVAVLVEAVLGVVEIDRSVLQDLPPALQSARSDLIEAVGRTDSELLVTLRIGRLVPDAVWESLTSEAGGKPQ